MIHRCLPILLWCWMSLAFAEEGTSRPLAAVIPEEAGLVLLVEDMPRLIEKWSRTPLIHGWDDNVLKRMFRSVRRRLLVGHWDDLLRHRLGFTLKEVQGLFRGPTAFVVPDLENIGKKDWSFGLIVDIGDDPGSARELMAAYYKDKAENAPDGVSLHTANESIHGLDAQRIEWWSAGEITETQGWTIIGRHLITARPMAYLSELAMAVGDGERPASLAEADDYRRIQDLNSDGDFLLVADSSQFSGLLQRLSGSDEMVEVDTQEKQIRQKTIPSILTKFDWGRLDRFYLTGNVRDEAVMLEFGTLFDESQNLPELAGFKPGPVELAAFLPDDPLSAVFYNFSHAAQQRSLEEQESSQGDANGWKTWMQKSSKKAGFDIEKVLLSSIGERMILAEYPTEDFGQKKDDGFASNHRANVFLALAITDPQGVAQTLDFLKQELDIAARLEPRSYLDSTLYVTREADGKKGAQNLFGNIAYSITEDYFLYSPEPKLVEQAISRLSNNAHLGHRLDDRLEGLLKPAGLQASVLGYADPAWDLKSVYEELVPLQDFLIKREAARQCGPSHSLDLDKLREGLGPSISTIYRSDGEFRWRWEIHYARR